jgi:hypothetical protein
MRAFMLVTKSLPPMLFLGGCVVLSAQERANSREGNFYEKSLHFTSRGLEHWYAKENGGLERITGIPFSQLPCGQCHVGTCDTCHLKEAKGRSVYSTEVARGEAACEKCHAMESQAFARENPADKSADVHFARGMKCMQCHSAREIHGDGVAYDSMQAPDAMDTRCENCHRDLSKCPSSAIHRGKVDCSACHVREVPSCYNCHFETRIKEGKSISLPLKDILFLINHDGRVTLANLHTFIYRNKTMIVFAPAFSHWVMKEGRKCPDCHGTQLLRKMDEGTLRLVTWESGKLRSVAGIVPVLEGFEWNFPFLDRANGSWESIPGAARPVLNYSGYSKPISREQFARLLKAQSSVHAALPR